MNDLVKNIIIIIIQLIQILITLSATQTRKQQQSVFLFPLQIVAGIMEIV